MNLDDAVQDLAAELGRPVTVLDADGRTVAYSMHESDVDRTRLGLVISRGDTWQLPRLVGRSGGAGTVGLAADGQVDARVVAPLRHEGQLVGFVLYFPDPEPGPETHPEPGAEARRDGRGDLLRRRADRIGRLLALRLVDTRRHRDRAHGLLARLLGEAAAPRETADAAEDRAVAAAALLSEGLIEEAGQYRVLVLRAPGAHPVSVARLAVDKTLGFIERSTTVKVVGTLLGNEGVLLFPRQVDRDRIERVLGDPDLADVRAGIGGSRPSLEELAASRREATWAWRASWLAPERHGRAAFWADLGLDKVLMRLPVESLTPNDLPRGVQRLIDSPNSALLAATLEGYLASGGDVQLTARRLGIHRSTLYYRLDRLRAVLDCDLGDGDVRGELHTGLRLARMAGHLRAG